MRLPGVVHTPRLPRRVPWCTLPSRFLVGPHVACGTGMWSSPQGALGVCWVCGLPWPLVAQQLAAHAFKFGVTVHEQSNEDGGMKPPAPALGAWTLELDPRREDKAHHGERQLAHRQRMASGQGVRLFPTFGVALRRHSTSDLALLHLGARRGRRGAVRSDRARLLAPGKHLAVRRRDLTHGGAQRRAEAAVRLGGVRALGGGLTAAVVWARVALLEHVQGQAARK